MRIWIGAVAALALAVGCGKKKDEEPKHEDKQAPAPAVAKSLWDLAPAGAVGGFVVNPGSFEKLYAGLDEVRRIAGGDPVLGPLIEKALAKGRKGAPFDIWSLDAAKKDGGVDPSRGFAIFLDPDGEVLLVAPPVADMDGLAKFMDEPNEEHDGRRIYSSKRLTCAEAKGRVVCARSLEAVDAAGDGGAKLTENVPARSRGDIEAIFDFARIPKASAGLSKVIRSPGKLSVGLRLDGGVATLDMFMVGQLVLPGAASKAPALPVDELARDAVGLVSVHWDAPAALKLAKLPPSMPVTPEFDARRDLLDQLTGEIAIATMSGRDAGGFRAEIGLNEPMPLRNSLADLCGAADKQLPQVRFDIQKGFCAAEFEVPPIPEVPAGLMPAGKVRAVIEVTPNGVRVTVGDPSSPGAVPPVSSHVAPYQSETSMVTGWGRSFDPLAALDDDSRASLDKLIASKTDARERAIIRAARWIVAHVAEIGFSMRLEDGGIGMSLTVVSFAADPKDVYTAYEGAVTKDLEGDRAGYRAEMKLLAGQKQTLAGAQAAVVERGGPALGFGTGVLAAVAIPAFVKYKQKSEMSDAFSEIKRIYDDVDAE